MSDELNEPIFEPENQTVCEITGAGHQWYWDYDAQEYVCDECGVFESQQE